MALFQGMGPEIGRGILSSALMMMVKERLTAAIKAAILGPPARVVAVAANK